MQLPDITLAATSGAEITLSQNHNCPVVIYFYPKDSTPGCTTEGQDFRDHFNQFKLFKTTIYGVSRDSIKSHENFKAKQNFPFELISDADEILCKAFDVIKEKNMYGRKYMGIERSTFLFNSHGLLQQQWRKVKLKGHVEEVLAAVKAL